MDVLTDLIQLSYRLLQIRERRIVIDLVKPYSKLTYFFDLFERYELALATSYRIFNGNGPNAAFKLGKIVVTLFLGNCLLKLFKGKIGLTRNQRNQAFVRDRMSCVGFVMIHMTCFLHKHFGMLTAQYKDG